MWKIVQSQEFGDWFKNIDTDIQVDIYAILKVLSEKGPSLGRPYVDSLKNSKINNLKELRVQSKGRPFRIAFVFDLNRNAFLLIGGNKRGDKRFYEKIIPLAEKIYKRYLGDL
ncbi:type II toxin-antitoxin system RelE/ParE family toxin [Leptospira interrogans]|uniref:Diaminopimelate decarboxylase n=3 Tax=Leptospira interrogans TaxID=173 RepID=A0AAQ0B0X1_LEPIR|nr:type II toxin-antitoxin system RelE/ParE family toxin [Leptospira interrogans]EMM97706.1 Gp49-like PF05973 family protein [Leptospira interrogans serovar Zanoni str. LT2156]EMN70321.1 Gp49-like PF05973 family protein [Leptospira interrogans serovar Bataviae str. UI 08561]KAA1292616.1 diaminopimelate decarboxylase [Leptospira interrogans serovar Geyaweera]EKR27810.1 Gp49-like PF05973 family protein [Leptospira interrogans serovar Bataviae str. L1111]KAA1292657.1 diaminopimelate decarboxylase